MIISANNVSLLITALLIAALASCGGSKTSTAGPPATATRSGAGTAAAPTIEGPVVQPRPTDATTPSVAPTINTPVRPTSGPGSTLSSPPASTPASGAIAAPTPLPLRPLEIERVFPNLQFSRLTNLVQPDEDADRLFVTEQSGRIFVFPNQQDAPQASLFLDLSSQVNEGHNEEGLLGLAFDPDFRSNGYFYVYYSAATPRRSVISRFSAGRTDPNTADADSELIIMEIPQPAGNHNGGQLAFGPDGYLYAGLGDGGESGDRFGNGQNPATLLGSILRIDVAAASENERYRVPEDNPFVGAGEARPEVWVYGLRNPWRFSFDTQSGRLWAADVGQNSWEEIDLIEKGLNYGWNVMEGAHCFSPGTGCNETGLQLPAAEYSTWEGCSVTGGYVYRGTALPSLFGAYVFGDFCSGKIWGIRFDGQSVTESMLLVDSDLQITSFGVDRAGNLYVVSRNQGVYRFAPDN